MVPGGLFESRGADFNKSDDTNVSRFLNENDSPLCDTIKYSLEASFPGIRYYRESEMFARS